MPELNLLTLLLVLVSAGLLNVWLLRPKRSTAYRGGASQNLRDEFAAYGLPTWFFLMIGGLKIGASIALIGGLWVPSLVVPAGTLVVGLMLGAIIMHLRVQDPLIKFVPAVLMLGMAATILVLRIG